MGFGSAGGYAAMSVVWDCPGVSRLAVVYPVDGQVDVPTSFNSNAEIPDPAPEYGVVGYPITVTVGAPMASADTTDPYELRLLAWSLRGPGGEEIEVLAGDPSTDEHLSNMVVLMPAQPLQSNTAYQAVLSVAWVGEEEELETRFTTGSGSAER